MHFDRSTYDSDYYAAQFNHQLRAPASPRHLLMEWTIALACANVDGGYGGPFGALIVDFSGAHPRVVGVGANHVVPENDPSAHAEMTAIRDAAKRLGRMDLSGLSLITSCECCPMCLAAVTAVGISDITFAANRRAAASAGFSDSDQYRLMAEGLAAQARLATPDEHQVLSSLLQHHEAALLIQTDKNKKTFFSVNETTSTGDPTALASVEALRAACRGLQSFHLPESAQLICRAKPHPMALIAADWARIGRRRSAEAPTNPALDDPIKDVSRIIYLHDDFEPMGNNCAAEMVIDELNRSLHSRRIPTVQLTENLHPNAPFEQWNQMLARGAQRY